MIGDYRPGEYTKRVYSPRSIDPELRKMAPTIVLGMPRKKREETDFGQRLVALRKAAGLTQVQLADAAGTSQRAISYYENHASFPPAPALIALAAALGVTTDELLGVGAPKREAVARQSPELRRLWKKFQQVGDLPERDQRAVIRLINSLSAASGAGEQRAGSGR